MPRRARGRRRPARSRARAVRDAGSSSSARTGWPARPARRDRRPADGAAAAGRLESASRRRSQEPRHLGGDELVLFAADDRAPGGRPARRRPAWRRRKRCLGARQPRQRIVDARLAAASPDLDGLHQRFERRGLHVDVAAADQHAVAAGANRPTADFGRLPAARCTAFISRSSLRITPSKPSSSRSSCCTIGGDSVAGQLLVERRHQHVGGHDEGDVGGDRGAERLELDRAQPIGRDARRAAARRANPRSVSPCPGKCLPQAATPAPCSARTTAAPSAPATLARPRPGRDRR